MPTPHSTTPPEPPTVTEEQLKRAVADAYERGFGEGVRHCQELAAKGVPLALWGER